MHKIGFFSKTSFFPRLKPIISYSCETDDWLWNSFRFPSLTNIFKEITVTKHNISKINSFSFSNNRRWQMLENPYRPCCFKNIRLMNSTIKQTFNYHVVQDLLLCNMLIYCYHWIKIHSIFTNDLIVPLRYKQVDDTEWLKNFHYHFTSIFNYLLL